MKDMDTEEAKRRAEWLNEHRAPKDWLIVTESEISSARTEFSAIERERDEAIKLGNKLADECDRVLGLGLHQNTLPRFKAALEAWRKNN